MQNAGLCTPYRPIATFNLDPANDSPPFSYDVDISELITLDDAMDAFRLGPNGGLMYCIEYLEKNTDWLQDKLQAHEGESRHYLA